MFAYKRLTMGPLGSNTYLLWDAATREAAVIDAGNRTDAVQGAAGDAGLHVRYLILTHAHYDHIAYMTEYLEAFPDAELLIHALDNPLLPNPRLNASALFGPAVAYPQAARTLADGERIPLGESEITVLHTPGHTPGGICLLAAPYLFTGDTLFYDGFGRTDLGAGSTAELAASIRRLYGLDPALTVLPGHGTRSTVGRAARENPFLDF